MYQRQTFTANSIKRTDDLTAIFEGEFDAANPNAVKGPDYDARRARYVDSRYGLLVERRRA